MLLWAGQVHFQFARLVLALLVVLGGFPLRRHLDCVCTGNDLIISHEDSLLTSHAVSLLDILTLGSHLIDVGELELIFLCPINA